PLSSISLLDALPIYFGSKRRLRAVMNMGPLSQYPVSPTGLVPARSPIGDTPLTLLGHESGHLFLAFVSVPDPAIPGSQPMFGKRSEEHTSELQSPDQ